MVQRPAAALAGVLFLVLAAGIAVQSGAFVGLFGPPSVSNSYGNATVTVADENGTELTAVDVRLADTDAKRYVGLSETASLEPGQGMLFVHDRAGQYAYVMRNMSFPLDIVFAAPNGTITTIHHAAVEPDASSGELTSYEGRGTYVLEVPRGYTNTTGIAVGDELRIPEDVA